MSQPRQRQPRELLNSIGLRCVSEHLDTEAGSAWSVAAFYAWSDDVCVLLGTLSPDPPKRSYYGRLGSLRNPHR